MFQVNRKNLLDCLKNLKLSVCSKVILPILSNVRITSKDGIAVLHTTDLELSIIEKIPSINDSELHDFTVSHSSLLALVENVDSVLIGFNVNEKTVEVIADSQNLTLDTIGAEDFPPFESISSENYSTFDSKDFKDNIDKVLACVHPDTSKNVLNSVFWESEDNHTNLVSTDGKILARYELGNKISLLNLKHNLPLKTMKVLKTLIGKNITDVKVGLNSSENTLIFELENITLTTKLIEGLFPNYKRAFPTNYTDLEITLSKKDLSKSLTTIGKLYKNVYEPTIDIHLEESKFNISIENKDIGKYNNSINSLNKISGHSPNIKVAVNQLLPVVNLINDEDITILANEHTNTGTPHPNSVMKLVDKSNSKIHLYVIKKYLKS